VIIVAGPKKACRDALVGANLLKMVRQGKRDEQVVPQYTI